MPRETSQIPDGLREFDDTKATRKLIYDNVLEAVQNRFPVEDDNFRLELVGAKYAGPTEFSLKQQKNAILHNRNLRTPIVGTWRLTDKRTGQVLDERQDAVMQVPYYTDRGTIINNGSEYTVVSQSRLRPGVYSRRKSNGGLEAQFNIDPRTGHSFRFGLNQNTGVFTLSTGQANIPLYPVLKACGVTDDQMIKYWGPDVAAANAAKSDPQAIRKVYERMAGYRADPNLTDADRSQYIRDNLSKYGVDPEVVERTMGLRNVEGVTPELMLRASQKVLNISRGDEEPDNRDNPRFSKYYSIEDFFKERVDKDAGRLSKTLLFKAKRNGNLKSVQRNALSPYIDTFINGSGLAMPGEEANPLSTLEQMSRITKFGEGGISSPEAVTMEARAVNGDYLGFVDPIAGPENEKIGVDVRTTFGARKGRDNKLYAPFRNARTGKTEYVDIGTAADRKIAFPGQDMSQPYVYVMKDGAPRKVRTSEVDYVVPSFANMMTSNTNINPLPTAVQTNRQFYGSKFWSQYLPQAKGEVPLVDSLMPDGKNTFSEYYGRKVGTLRTDTSGVVTKVTDDEITIKGDDGKSRKIELVKNLPFNRLSSISFMPSVQVGQQVAAGDMVANSNYTDGKTGSLNIGQNLHVAILPYRGESFEDGITISESAARRMATDRLYSFDHEARNGVTIGRDKYISAFPSKFTKEQVETLDENGIVKPGTILKRGDPIVLSLGPRVLTSSDKALGKLSKALRNSYTDRSETWEHDYPGKVVDAVKVASGAKVNVVAQPPIREGDKMCYDPETEVLTSSGWKRICDVTLDDSVATMDPDSLRFDYLKPEAVHAFRHNGKMYRLESQQLDVLVTTNHRLFVQMRGHDHFGLYEPDKVFGKRVSYKKDGEWVGDEPESFTFPPTFVGHRWGAVLRPETKIPIETFLMLLGMFISEGNCVCDRRSASYGIDICQKKPDSVSEAKKAFSDAGLDLKYIASNGKWRLYGAQYYEYFKQFGHAADKYLPNFVFGLSPRLQRILLKWLMWGDGHCKSGRYVCYTTTSKRLADDVQRLCLHCGYAANVSYCRAKAGSVHGKIDGRQIVSLHDVHDVRILTSKLTPSVNHGHVKSQHAQTERYEDYDGMVYCCTMPKWGVIYVRRNGKPYWCGNSPRFGLKGVVSHVIDDDKMPRNAATNQPYDILMNPMGFLSRVAPGQLMEIALGKVAKQTGRQIRIPQLPPPEGWNAWVKAQMDAAGVTDSSDVFDPETGRVIPNVGDGYAYFMAFHHLAEKKESMRSSDAAYTQDEQPAKGGVSGAKRASGLDLWALLSHGATDVIKDNQIIRGTRNDNYWNALKLGLPIPEPGEPFIYKKFLNTLRAGGVNVVEKGNVTSIMPQTDKDIDALAKGREITSSDMVDSDFEPMKGGLFDLGKTGGMAGNQWSMIRLPEPVPNPIMEEPVRRVLGLTTSQMERILSGQEKLNGKTGGFALKDALSKVDVDKRLEEAHRDILSKRGSARDDAVKVYRYLQGMKKQGLSPQDWMISRIPVLPPAFRPVSKMGDVALVSDMNRLYKDVIDNAENFRELQKDLSDSSLADERLNIYNSVKAAFGLGQPITPENQAKGVKGAIRQVIGTSPKFGQFQSKVLSKTVDTVGRGVTVADPNLDMDQVGIPEKMAWEIYKPYVTRALVRHGYSAAAAVKMIADKDKTARHLLDEEMQRRPIIMDRAPTWHKFNFMAFTPHIVDSDTIHVSPLVDPSYNMDHDGDTVNVHVPSSQKAVDQANRTMRPSQNLISLTNLSGPMYQPGKEQIFGLYAATSKVANKPVKVFNSVSDAKRAYARGEIGMNDPIEIRQ